MGEAVYSRCNPLHAAENIMTTMACQKKHYIVGALKPAGGGGVPAVLEEL